MSFFREAMRPPLTADDAVRRYVERVRADIEPDPLFRRRLRGEVTNRFVAAREGLADAEPRRTQMGRLGRACLYASFALAVSVGGTLAASRGAVPGDLLYPVKLQLEAIRLETFPQEFHDDLLTYALGERMAEFGRLVEEGELARAAGMAETIADGYQELAAMGIHVGADDLPANLAVLQALSERLPAPAQAAIQRAIHDAPGLAGTTPAPGEAQQPAAAGSSVTRPSIVPADERAKGPINRADPTQPARSSTPASPHAAEEPGHSGQPQADDEDTSGD